MKHYGDLEKYLGSKYAKDASQDDELVATYQEARDILNSELDAMAILNRMTIIGLGRRKQSQNVKN